MAKTGAEIFEKYRRNMGNATTDIKNGVLNTTKSQSKNAIAAKTRYQENLQKAINEGKWEKGLEEAGDDKWRDNFINKGLNKITTGIDANADAIETKFDKVARVSEKVKTECAKLPKGGISNALARVEKAITITQDEWS